MAITTNENWAAAASTYALQVERLTTPPSRTLLNRVSQLLPLDTPNSHCFDNGCGTGALSAIIKQQNPQTPLLATDASDGMIATVRRRITAQKWARVSARVVDGRSLEGIDDASFTHTLSTFMVCLAPEPEKIAREMWRVTKEDGVLGLAVWGRPRFGPFTAPWEKACREQVPGYEAPVLMGEEWTVGGKVKGGLERAGFRDVEVWEEDCVWGWESAGAVAGYYFEGGNPVNLREVESFRALGGDVEKARPVFERVVGEEWGVGDGAVELHALATLATARK
ncbi:MAG: hypothetical protein Q9161_009710 [Pseudevernia consocians]